MIKIWSNFRLFANFTSCFLRPFQSDYWQLPPPNLCQSDPLGRSPFRRNTTWCLQQSVLEDVGAFNFLSHLVSHAFRIYLKFFDVFFPDQMVKTRINQTIKWEKKMFLGYQLRLIFAEARNLLPGLHQKMLSQILKGKFVFGLFWRTCRTGV